MTIESETLLPEPSSSDVPTEMVQSDVREDEDIMVNETAEAPVSSCALPTSSADLFGGELGVDELNGEFIACATVPFACQSIFFLT